MAPALVMLKTEGKKEHNMMKNIKIQKCMSVKYEIAHTLNMLSRVSKGYHDMNEGLCCARFDETAFS